MMIYSGCKTPTESTKASSIFGVVGLFDGSGKSLPSDSVLISITNPAQTKLSDSAGNWVLTGLEGTSYDVTLSKTGFGSVKLFAVASGNSPSLPIQTYLGKPTSDRVNFQTILLDLNSKDTNGTIHIQGSVSPPWELQRYMVLCISTDSVALASTPGTAPVLITFLLSGDLYPKINYSGDFEWEIKGISSVAKQVLQAGINYYAAICIAGEGIHAAEVSNYLDPTTKKQMFTSLGKHTQIVKFQAQ